MNGIYLTTIGFSIIFLATTLGSALVFFFKTAVSEKTNRVLLGFAAGIMTAASVWSLLLPSIDGSASYGKFNFLPALIGFLLGGIFLVLLDKVIPQKTFERDNIKLQKNSKKAFKLFLAITVHNIPEGLAVGFAFGGAALMNTREALFAALGLSIGIAVQNFPEGAAVSLPMKGNGMSKIKAFLYGTFSGAVEPIAAIIGYFLAAYLKAAQPWFLAFAAGAMMFVVVEDIIPDAHAEDKFHISAWGFMLGFALMMVLDVALG